MCGLCEASGWDVPREEKAEVTWNAPWNEGVMYSAGTPTIATDPPKVDYAVNPNSIIPGEVVPRSQDWNRLFLEALDVIKELWWRLESLEMNADVNHQRTTRLRNDAEERIKELQDKSGVK